MSELGIGHEVLSAMIDHARAHSPEEACGLLSGGDGAVRTLHQMTNADASSEHFSMVPKEQFAAVKAMRAAGERMLAVYHSHPETPARPSEEDIRLGLEPGVVHVILSLAGAGPPVVKGYQIEDGTVTEVKISVEEKP